MSPKVSQEGFVLGARRILVRDAPHTLRLPRCLIHGEVNQAIGLPRCFDASAFGGSQPGGEYVTSEIAIAGLVFMLLALYFYVMLRRARAEIERLNNRLKDMKAEKQLLRDDNDSLRDHCDRLRDLADRKDDALEAANAQIQATNQFLADNYPRMVPLGPRPVDKAEPHVPRHIKRSNGNGDRPDNVYPIA
jgi:hypothetical protein